MKFLVLSDLHFDFWTDVGRDPFAGSEYIFADLDHFLIAGDLTNKPKVRWKYAFERLSRLLPLERVSIFPGNHDFYDFRLDGEDRLAQIASGFGIRYAQKRQLVFDDVRILCATLWTDFELGGHKSVNENQIQAQMNDFKHIRIASKGYRRLRPSDLVTQHRNHFSWLDCALSEPFDGQTFVATHHAPHPSVLQGHLGSVGAAYASDLSELIRKHQPDRWFFGHCHDAQDSRVGTTQLINVSLGYPDEVLEPSARVESLIQED